MTAARLEVFWDRAQVDTFTVKTAPTSGVHAVRQIVPSRRAVRCPECDSIIYSRRHRLCGVCNQPLPDNLLFSASEAERVQNLLSQERERHKKWMAQRSQAQL